MASDFVHDRIRDAAKHIHHDLVVDFEEAHISLADGLIPELAVVIEKIRFESANKCWGSPSGAVTEVRLPLNFWQALHGQLSISKVSLDHVDVQLHSQLSDCAPAAEVAAEVKSASEGKSAKKDEEAKKSFVIAINSRGPVQHVFVRSIRIQPLSLPSTDIDIEHLAVDKLADAPDHFHVGGHVNLGGLTFSGDFTSHAQFEIDYMSAKAALDVRGSWREGKYALSAQTNLSDKTYDAKGHIEHLPMVQIFQLLKKYWAGIGDFDGRQVWLNLDFSTVGTQVMAKPPLLRVDRLNVEGDLGAIEGGNFVISKWSPLELSATDIYLRNFKLEKILSFFGSDKKPQSFGNLGEINGVFRSIGPQQFEMSGEFSGLEFVFSNRGERKIQLISLMSGHLEYNQGLWSFLLDKIRPYEGLMLGQVKLWGQDGKPNVDVEMHVEEMHLGPEVQALMSGNGSLGRWAGDLKGTFDRTGLKRLQGQVFAQDLQVEGLDLPRLKANFTTAGERLQIDILGQNPSIRDGSRVRKMLDTLLAPFAQKGPLPPLAANQASLSFDFIPTSNLHWRMKPAIFADLSVRTEGQWNQDGQLDGRVTISRRGDEHQWKIRGTREMPEFIGNNFQTGVRSEASPAW